MNYAGSPSVMKFKGPDANSLRSFVFGAFVATEAALVVGWWVSENGDTLYQILTDWSGFAATIIAAFIAFQSVMIGIRYQRTRELVGARAILPMALSNLSALSNDGLRLCANVNGERDNLTSDQIFERLRMSEATLEQLQQNISWSPTNAEKWMTVLIANYQVFLSRCKRWSDSEESVETERGVFLVPADLIDALLDWATFSALVDHLYEYARGADDAAELFDVERIPAKFFLMFDVMQEEMGENFRNALDDRQKLLEPGDVTRFRRGSR